MNDVNSIDPKKPSEKYIEIETYARPEDPLAVTRNLYEFLRTRRSIRNFTSEPIDREILLNAIKVAGTAPNGANCQPWFFAVIESQKVKNRIRNEAENVEKIFYSNRASAEWLSDLEPIGTDASKSYLSTAPALIAVFTRQRVASTLGTESIKSYYPVESTGIAVGLLLSALHHAGVGTLTHTPRPMNFLNELLNLDRTYRPLIIVVTGYPAKPVLVPNLKRKPLKDICQIY